MTTDEAIARKYVDVVSAGIADLGHEIDALLRERAELLSALRLLVSCLRREEHWPVKSEHLGYLADAEGAIRRVEDIETAMKRAEAQL